MSPAHPVTFRLAALQASWTVTRWAFFGLLRHTPLTLPHCRVLSARPRNFPQRTFLRHTGALLGLDFRPELFPFPLKTGKINRSSQAAVRGYFSPPDVLVPPHIPIDHPHKRHTLDFAAVARIQLRCLMRTCIFGRAVLDCYLFCFPIIQKPIVGRPAEFLQCTAEDSDSSIYSIKGQAQHPLIPCSFIHFSPLLKNGRTSPLVSVECFYLFPVSGSFFPVKMPIDTYPSICLISDSFRCSSTGTPKVPAISSG